MSNARSLTPRNVVNVKNIRSTKKSTASERDIYERLHSRSLHTYDELKDILRDLFTQINEQAKSDFEEIFELEQKLQEIEYQPEEPVQIDFPSTSKKIFFNPRPYEKIPIADYSIVDNMTFHSGPFYHADEVSKNIFAKLRELGEKYAKPSSDSEAKTEEEDEKAPLTEQGVQFFNKLIPQQASSGANKVEQTQLFETENKLKTGNLNIHFVIATVMQRANALKQDRDKLIEKMKAIIEEHEEGEEEEEVEEEEEEVEEEEEGEEEPEETPSS
ncbi:hypothetical protein BLNAU_10835 [Blattamonas nauphoetae]|uniref:Uncharacterized protein n=1 Tax=Blattamonas nauphoetae TaxID=2049346 RepID=A0ABQ9XQ40_9EUKA|nr:hypothetical protein BLNAU_10835 [Blattamonas nauphoetae]